MITIAFDRKNVKYVLDIGYKGVCESQSYLIMLIKEHYDKNCEVEHGKVVLKFWRGK